MSLIVLKDDLETIPLHNIIEKDSIGLPIFVQIVPYFNHK
jgi:hypothetical protein